MISKFILEDPRFSGIWKIESELDLIHSMGKVPIPCSESQKGVVGTIIIS
jgi:hypothetical protein